MKKLGLLCIVALALLFIPKNVSATNGPLRKSSNPSYFVDASGKAVYLSGQHTWWGFYTGGAAPGGNFDALLSTYHNKGHNFTRMWTGDGVQSSLTNSTNSPKMWLSGPACCNQEHIDRLVALAAKAKSYDMYISIMLHEGWWVGDNATTAVNWYNNHFFKSVEGDVNKYFTEVNGTVYSLQKQRIQKVVDALRPYDNIIYEICNECHILGGYRDENTQWQKDLINYIHSIDSTKMVGFTDNGDADINNIMLNSTADWVSIWGDNLKTDPPIADTRKVHLLDTDHIQCAGQGCITSDDWIWKTFTRGYNPIIMDDWNNFGGQNAAAAAASGTTVWMANQRVSNLLSMRPNATPCNTSYCLSNGTEVVAYYPSGSSVPSFGSGWNYEMYSTTSKSPSSGNKVLYAYKSGGVPNTPIPQPTTNTPPPTSTPDIPIPTTGFKGQYFNNMTLSGNPLVTRLDNEINFDWGTSSPATGIPADMFSVRWSSNPNLAAGSYTFNITTDDGMRVFVDGNKIIDKWFDQPATPYSAMINLSAGSHLIVIEYYENSQSALAKANWSSQSSCNTTKPNDGSIFSIIPCSGQGGNCSISVNSWIKYGAGNSYCYSGFPPPSMNCSNTSFGGDPAPGQTKNCYPQVRTDYTFINSTYGTNSVNSDLNKDNLVNTIDFAVMISSKQW